MRSGRSHALGIDETRVRGIEITSRDISCAYEAKIALMFLDILSGKKEEAHGLIAYAN